MTFFDPTPPKTHHCTLPTGWTTKQGWRCECGKAYVREWLGSKDTNPGEQPWQWRRAKEHDTTTTN